MDGMVADGTLLRVAVDGWDAPGYVHCSHQALLKKAQKGALEPTHSTLLSPFDPVVWDRRRFEHLWGWPYRFEAYTPAAKRVYGYYALPILWRDRAVGWINAAPDAGKLAFYAGYAGSKPRDSSFRRALDDEFPGIRARAFRTPLGPPVAYPVQFRVLGTTERDGDRMRGTIEVRALKTTVFDARGLSQKRGQARFKERPSARPLVEGSTVRLPFEADAGAAAGMAGGLFAY